MRFAMRALLGPAALAIAAGSAPATAQGPSPSGAAIGYADLADLAAAAPIVADVTARAAQRLKGADAPGLAPGHARFLIDADVQALLHGAAGLPGRVTYLADLPLDGTNHAPRIRKARFLLFAAAVPGKPAELRLVSPQATPAWTAALDARVRAILTAASAADAPPRITGIGKAFHVPGTLPGEGETQIFLTTTDARPVSLSILRRPGEDPRWAVALGELVDEAAEPPARDTLLWYRLACFLPPALPEAATAELAPADAEAARADYTVVTAGLGACGRGGG